MKRALCIFSIESNRRKERNVNKIFKDLVLILFNLMIYDEFEMVLIYMRISSLKDYTKNVELVFSVTE